MKTAQGCRSFLASRDPPVDSRLVEHPVRSSAPPPPESDPDSAIKNRTILIYACFFPAADFPVAKQYWQHTGDGISSRVAERCLTLLGELEGAGAAVAVGGEAERAVEPEVSPKIGAGGGAGRYGSKSRYQVSKASTPSSTIISPPLLSSKLRYSTNQNRSRNGINSDESEPSSLSNSVETLPPRAPLSPPLLASNGLLAVDQDEDVLTRYVEERYGRNLDLSLAPLAKLAMRRRIAGVLRETPGQAIPVERMQKTEGEESTRGVVSLTEEDVWLYPGGMSAIFHAHQLAMGAREKEGGEIGKSVCFG